MQPKNGTFYAAVKDAYNRIREAAQTSYADVNTEPCLSQFRWAVVDYNQTTEALTLCRRLAQSAFEAPHTKQAHESVVAFLSNVHGLTEEQGICHIVNDFLNYVGPRIIGLQDEAQLFDTHYSELEDALFTDEFKICVVAIMRNVVDHSGSIGPAGGVTFKWLQAPGPFPINTKYLRDRIIPFLEFRSAGRPAGRGRSLESEKVYFVMQYEERCKKNSSSVTYAYRRTVEIATKVVLAFRIVSGMPIYSDYRGFRMPGHLSADGMEMMNWPDEVIDSDETAIMEHYPHTLEKLLPELLQIPSDKLAVINTKLDDSLRRRRGDWFTHSNAEKRNQVDILLDYCQLLESLLSPPPGEGSFQLALYTAVLLAKALPVKATHAHDLITRMYRLRNDVMHGRINKVLDDDGTGKQGIAGLGQFCYYVRMMIAIGILNGVGIDKKDLKEQAKLLALGEQVSLVSP